MTNDRMPLHPYYTSRTYYIELFRSMGDDEETARAKATAEYDKAAHIAAHAAWDDWLAQHVRSDLMERYLVRMDAGRKLLPDGSMVYEADDPETTRELERLRTENAALREIVRLVTEADNSDGGVCVQLCDVRWYGGATDSSELVMRHDGECLVDRARAVLAQTTDH